MSILAAFKRPFKYQVAAFRLRLRNLVPTARWDDLWQSEHDRAFMVAGALKADLLADLAAAVDKAIAQGTSLEEFRRDFRQIVTDRGWHGWTGEGTKKGEAWRTRVIYRTNMATSYAAGRWAQIAEGGYPFIVYRHGNSVEPRLQHLEWDGLVLPADHPFWATHAPPNGWGCSCYVNGARSIDSARRVGGKPGKELDPGWAALDPKTGAPKGISKGWAYAPGASVAPAAISAVAGTLARVPPRIGADLAQAHAAGVDRAWDDWLVTARERRQPEHGLVGAFTAEQIEALAAVSILPARAHLLVSPGLVAGPKALRHAARGDALTAEEWQRLPLLLRSARAMLLDRRTGKVLFVLPAPAGDQRTAQLTIEVALPDGRTPEEGQGLRNIVVSAYRPKLSDLLGRIAGQLIQTIWGSLE